MTTYQGARWVEQQIASILAQTRLPDEVLVYDDGSTDGTPDLVRALLSASPVPWTVTVNVERLGTVRSLEQGLRVTAADVVLLADQDDVWHPDRLARLVAAEALVFHDARLVDGDGRDSGRTLWSQVGFTAVRRERLALEPLAVLLEGNPVTGATLAVPASLLQLALPFPEQGWHDYWLALVAAAHGLPVLALPDLLLDYRLHANNAAGLPPTGLRGRLQGAPAARDHRAVLIAMFAELVDRLPAGMPREQAQAAAEHLRFRQDLPRLGFARLRPVLRHLAKGGYAAQGGSWRTAAVDLLERRA